MMIQTGYNSSERANGKPLATVAAILRLEYCDMEYFIY